MNKFPGKIVFCTATPKFQVIDFEGIDDASKI